MISYIILWSAAVFVFNRIGAHSCIGWTTFQLYWKNGDILDLQCTQKTLYAKKIPYFLASMCFTHSYYSASHNNRQWKQLKLKTKAEKLKSVKTSYKMLLTGTFDKDLLCNKTI